MKKIPVGVLGATGMVGQQYIMRLIDHPWFELAFLAASDRSANKSYGEAVSGRWLGDRGISDSIQKRWVHSLDEIHEAKSRCRFVFSALANEGAEIFEELYAKEGLPVVSNASCHRNTPDVPILIPEVNPHHLDILSHQKKRRGSEKGFIVVKPNCSLQSYMIPLAPLHTKFRVKKISVTTLQAVSGAGYPGPSSYDMFDNVIPFIPGEEEKSENEPRKIWGEIKENVIHPASHIQISAHCNRVAVLDGHLACVSVEFESRPPLPEIVELWNQFLGEPQRLDLPSAPTKPLLYLEEKDRPQPRRDRDAGKGMAVTCGRLRSCPLHHIRFVALSHNTIRGAAGGAILNAELLVKKGYIDP